MWELDCEERWAPNNWCFWTAVLEKTLVSPLDGKEIKTVHPKGDQSWVFIGRTDAEAETLIRWPPQVKGWLIGKDPEVGRDWGQEENGTTEDEMAGWHHRLDAHEFGWTPGVGDGQGGLACCNSWGRKESDMTERLNWTELMSSLEKCLFTSSAVFWIALFIFLILSCMCYLYTLDTNPLQVASFTIIFFHSYGCLWIFCIVFFAMQNL